MNETRNIIVGLKSENQSQICYYDRREKEPISVSVKAGSNQYLFPTRLSKKPGEEVWHYGMEADYFPARKGKFPLPGFWGFLEARRKSSWTEKKESLLNCWKTI